MQNLAPFFELAVQSPQDEIVYEALKVAVFLVCANSMVVVYLACAIFRYDLDHQRKLLVILFLYWLAVFAHCWSTFEKTRHDHFYKNSVRRQQYMDGPKVREEWRLEEKRRLEGKPGYEVV